MKKIIIFIVAAILVFSLAGCNKKPTDPQNIDKTIEENKEEEKDIAEGWDVIVSDVVGHYVGQIDGNSIEIIIDNTPNAYRLPEELKEKISNLPNDREVMFSYMEKTEDINGEKITRLILKDIELTNKETQELPESIKISMELEGNPEEREAFLQKSKNFPYHLYLLQGYTFEENTEKSLVKMDYDKDFFVEIAELHSSESLDTRVKEIKEEYQKFGEVVDIKPSQHFDPYFRDARYYFTASAPNKGSKMALVKEVDGHMMLYKINMPLKEAAEGAGPALWAIIKTLHF